MQSFTDKIKISPSPIFAVGDDAGRRRDVAKYERTGNKIELRIAGVAVVGINNRELQNFTRRRRTRAARKSRNTWDRQCRPGMCRGFS